MRIIGNNENNCSNVSPSGSSSRNIPVAMSPRCWKVNSAILLGSEHPVLCAKWWIRCCLYEAVLSKIPLQLLHLKAIDCCPPPGWTLPLFDLLIVSRSKADRSNEHSRSQVCTKRCPKIGRYWQHKNQHCIVHINKNQTIHKTGSVG